MKMDNFQSAEKLTDHYYIVNYISNSSFGDDENWIAPKMSAVQLSTAITACARIHMYPYISRPDCYLRRSKLFRFDCEGGTPQVYSLPEGGTVK